MTTQRYQREQRRQANERGHDTRTCKHCNTWRAALAAGATRRTHPRHEAVDERQHPHYVEAQHGVGRWTTAQCESTFAGLRCEFFDGHDGDHSAHRGRS